MAGWLKPAEGGARAFLWSASDGMTDLGTLGGPQSAAYGINSRRQVVGEAQDALGRWRVFLWSAPGGMVDLGTLGGEESAAYGISDAGHVVGWAATGTLPAAGPV